MRKLMSIQVAGQLLNGFLAYDIWMGSPNANSRSSDGIAHCAGFVCIALISAMFAIDRKGEFGVWAGRRFNPDLFVRLSGTVSQRFQVLLRDACNGRHS